MRLLVSRKNICRWAAAYIKKQAALIQVQKNYFVLGLPTGETVLEMYRFLCEFARKHEIDFSHIITFNMDEYVGLPPTDPQSYHYYMEQNLFKQVALPPVQTHIPNAMSADLEKACIHYEQAIHNCGGIDLFIGGVGRNGHLAFNEPGSSFSSRTRLVELTSSTRQSNARFFEGDIQRVPTQALSVGIGTVLDARELLFLANGAHKAEAVARLAQGEITPQWPITALKTHSCATLLVDEAAASLLTGPVQQTLLAQQAKFPEADTWTINL